MWHAYLQSSLTARHWPAAEMKSWPDFRPRQQLKDNRQPIHVIHLTELRPHKIHLTAALEPFQQPNQICPEASLSLSPSLFWAGLGHILWAWPPAAVSTGPGAGQRGEPRLVANGEMIAFYDLIKLDTNRSVDVYLSFALSFSLSARDSVLLSLSLFLALALMRVLVLWDIFMRSTRPKLLSQTEYGKVCQLDKWIII